MKFSGCDWNKKAYIECASHALRFKDALQFQTIQCKAVKLILQLLYRTRFNHYCLCL